MKLETIALGDRFVKIKSENSKEDSNYYTLLIGENGVGKTKIFEDLLQKEKNHFKKIIFSSYTLFNRTSKYSSNKSTNVYISNFNSKNIISQVANLYVKNSWLYHNELFENTLNEIYRILEIGNEVRVDLSSITGISYQELFNKIQLDYQNKPLLELLEERAEISQFTMEDLFEVFEERRSGFRGSQINKMLTTHYFDNKRVQKLSPSEKRTYEIILIIKSLLIDAGYKKRSEGRSTYFLYEEIAKLYHEYFNLSGDAISDLLKIDFQLFTLFELAFADNLLFMDDAENPETKQLDDLSSGEFAMITRFMELAGEVEEGSLVLIDEPETFLNPKWINEFIYLLKTLFKDRHCHFILASQSPFIINNLKKEDLITLKKVGNKVVHQYEEEETFGADFDSIVKEIFHIDLSDNKVVHRYVEAVEKKSKENILEAFRMIATLADSAIKVELMQKIANKDNLEIIKEEIAHIERKHFDE